MNFEISPEVRDLQQRVRHFIADEIVPMESDRGQTAHGPTEALRRQLVAKARAAGLLAPHVSPEYGGLGLSHFGKAIVFEEAGYSPLGPIALNIFAPDEGNMHLLEAIARPEHKERWLRPLAQRRDPFLLLHDRARPRRRFRSVDARRPPRRSEAIAT